MEPPAGDRQQQRRWQGLHQKTDATQREVAARPEARRARAPLASALVLALVLVLVLVLVLALVLASLWCRRRGRAQP